MIVSNVDNEKPVNNLPVRLQILYKEKSWHPATIKEEKIARTGEDGIARFNLSPKPKTKYIEVKANIGFNGTKPAIMYESRGQMEIHGWVSDIGFILE